MVTPESEAAAGQLGGQAAPAVPVQPQVKVGRCPADAEAAGGGVGRRDRGIHLF